jgi:hypothetical protein
MRDFKGSDCADPTAELVRLLRDRGADIERTKHGHGSSGRLGCTWQRYGG